MPKIQKNWSFIVEICGNPITTVLNLVLHSTNAKAQELFWGMKL
jgi:hypothetical protein